MIEFVANEDEMRALGAKLVKQMQAGDLVLLYGELGAGKTTLVRGALAALGAEEGVRSPTFNLLSVYETTPPTLHVDLYRVKSDTGLGIEDYLESHLVFVEWPDRSQDLERNPRAMRIHIEFAGTGRSVRIEVPNQPQT